MSKMSKFRTYCQRIQYISSLSLYVNNRTSKQTVNWTSDGTYKRKWNDNVSSGWEIWQKSTGLKRRLLRWQKGYNNFSVVIDNHMLRILKMDWVMIRIPCGGTVDDKVHESNVLIKIYELVVLSVCWIIVVVINLSNTMYIRSWCIFILGFEKVMMSR